MKRLILCVLFLGILLPAGARRYPFMRPDKNRIQYPAGSSPDYQLFLRKLDSLLVTGSTDVKVLHMGGSHVQGGTLTDRLRKHFLSLRYGIDGGKISKATLKIKGEVVYNYDRGLDVPPQNEAAETALAILMYEYN